MTTKLKYRATMVDPDTPNVEVTRNYTVLLAPLPGEAIVHRTTYNQAAQLVERMAKKEAESLGLEYQMISLANRW